MAIRVHFDKLTPETFRQRVQTNFSSNLLTLNSVTQGVVLAVLADKFLAAATTQPQEPSLYIYAVTTFLFVAGVSYYYFYFQSVVFTPPTIFQVIIPLTVGVTEVIAAYFAATPGTFLLFASFVFTLGAAAFLNTLLICCATGFSDEMKSALYLLKKESVKNVSCFLLMAIIAMTLWLNYPDDKNFHIYIDALFFGLSGSCFLFQVYLTETRLIRKLFELANLIEKET